MNNIRVNKIQVFVISQQSLFLSAVEQIFSDTEDIAVLGTTGVNSDVLKAIDNLPPDVALVDLDGQAENGLELGRKNKQRSPNIGVILLTSNPDDNQACLARQDQ